MVALEHDLLRLAITPSRLGRLRLQLSRGVVEVIRALFGWCMDGHHAQCRRTTPRGSVCSCPCHG
jgi:hypothetical protein